MATQFNPGFSQNLRNDAYRNENISPVPNSPNELNELVRELEVMNRFRRSNSGSNNLNSSSGNPIFDLGNSL